MNKTQSLGPFLGVNNRLPDFALTLEKKGSYLRSASNVDLDDAGHLRRRTGQTRVQALTNPHSLFETRDGRFFMALSSVLYEVTLPSYTQTLIKVLTNDDPVSYVEHNGDTYYSNGTDSGRIAADNTWYPWALPTPTLPGVSATPGTLPAGHYLVAVTHYNSVTGEESGCGGATAYKLEIPGSLRVSLPGAVTGATHINVYVSATNGEVPCLRATVTAGTSSYIVSELTVSRPCLTMFQEPLPACSGLFMHMGRLGGLVGQTVVYGEPWRPGYYQPVANRIDFEKAVSLVVPAQNGCYVVAELTRWFEGDLANPARIADVLPYPGVPGTAFKAISDETVGWFSSAGVVIADTAGQVSAVMADPIDLTAPATGCSRTTAENGFEKVISCGWAVNLTTKAATTYNSYDYTSFAGDYGTKANGVYQLSGDTDNGGDIVASVGFGKLNFGSENLKTIIAAFFGGSAAAPLRLLLQTPYSPVYDYRAKWASPDLRMQRATPGKGLVASWFDATLRNEHGADFTLATATFSIFESTRRL